MAQIESMSKYAKKRALQLRGVFSPTSPFVPADHPSAQNVDRWVDSNGRARRGADYLRVGREDEGAQMSPEEYARLYQIAAGEGRLTRGHGLEH